MEIFLLVSAIVAVSQADTFATGLVSQQCLQCMCLLESNCQPVGCAIDEGTDSCGYFQIKNDYWLDCGSPGNSWHECADDIHCSSLCVQNYMKRYASLFHCPLTCEGFAREHNGGPKGCHHHNTDTYWTNLQKRGCNQSS